jgi:hypothetical protein
MISVLSSGASANPVNNALASPTWNFSYSWLVPWPALPNEINRTINDATEKVTVLFIIPYLSEIFYTLVWRENTSFCLVNGKTGKFMTDFYLELLKIVIYLLKEPEILNNKKLPHFIAAVNLKLKPMRKFTRSP